MRVEPRAEAKSLKVAGSWLGSNFEGLALLKNTHVLGPSGLNVRTINFRRSIVKNQKLVCTIFVLF